MAALEKLRKLLMTAGTRAKTTERFDRLMEKVDLLSCEEGKASFKMKVEEGHLNGVGTLHGGMTATLIDNLTTLAILTKPPHQSGVSVDMSISYLRPARIGDEIVINTEVTKLGQSLAFTSAELVHQDGKIIAKGSHTKYVGERASTPAAETV